jgi:hypothetical protein
MRVLRHLAPYIAAALLTLAAVARAEVPPPIPPGVAPIDEPTSLVDGSRLGVPTPIQDPSGRALQAFYAALRRTSRGEGQTRIVVWGASHIAGDGFTKVIRHRLQARFGDAGPGFVVAAKPWHDYNHKDVAIEYSKGWESYWVGPTRSREDGLYGLAGCSFGSDSKHDFCRLATGQDKEGYGRDITRAELYYWQQPGGGDLMVKVDGKLARRVQTKSKEALPG